MIVVAGRHGNWSGWLPNTCSRIRQGNISKRSNPCLVTFDDVITLLPHDASSTDSIHDGFSHDVTWQKDVTVDDHASRDDAGDEVSSRLGLAQPVLSVRVDGDDGPLADEQDDRPGGDELYHQRKHGKQLARHLVRVVQIQAVFERPVPEWPGQEWHPTAGQLTDQGQGIDDADRRHVDGQGVQAQSDGRPEEGEVGAVEEEPEQGQGRERVEIHGVGRPRYEVYTQRLISWIDRHRDVRHVSGIQATHLIFIRLTEYSLDSLNIHKTHWIFIKLTEYS